jgi:hypothetical protein
MGWFWADRQSSATAVAAQWQEGKLSQQDYQMQLMLLEQQNKSRLASQREEKGNMKAPHPMPRGGVEPPVC